MFTLINMQYFQSEVLALLEMKYKCLPRHWSLKFATGLDMIIDCSSKSIWVIKLSFCQNDPFCQNNSLVTHILFELCRIWYINPVANFVTHPLCANRSSNNSDFQVDDKKFCTSLHKMSRSLRMYVSRTFEIADWFI